MRIVAIITSRMTSSRLPGKAMLDIHGKPNLQRIVERVRCAERIDEVVVATTTNEADDRIADFCQEKGYACFRGSEENVLDRVLKAAIAYQADVVVDITGDESLIDYHLINALVEEHLMSEGKCDMTTNIVERTFPRGQDIRIVNLETLQRINKEVDNDIDREHVYTWAYLNPKGRENYTINSIVAPPYLHRPDYEIVLDDKNDYELIKFIYGFSLNGYNLELNCEQIIDILDIYPQAYAQVLKTKRKDYFESLESWYANYEVIPPEPPTPPAKKKKTGRPRKVKKNEQ